MCLVLELTQFGIHELEFRFKTRLNSFSTNPGEEGLYLWKRVRRETSSSTLNRDIEKWQESDPKVEVGCRRWDVATTGRHGIIHRGGMLTGGGNDPPPKEVGCCHHRQN